MILVSDDLITLFGSYLVIYSLGYGGSYLVDQLIAIFGMFK
jgi:hypothetical protein